MRILNKIIEGLSIEKQSFPNETLPIELLTQHYSYLEDVAKPFSGNVELRSVKRTDLPDDYNGKADRFTIVAFQNGKPIFKLGGHPTEEGGARLQAYILKNVKLKETEKIADCSKNNKGIINYKGKKIIINKGIFGNSDYTYRGEILHMMDSYMYGYSEEEVLDKFKTYLDTH